ncbi:MAG: ATP phosphoribosyltransferase [Chloroflexota bacterium]
MCIQRQDIRLALPKGRLLASTSDVLSKGGLDFADYAESTRMYSFRSARFPGVTAKMFQEKDIPVQVAVGNYDLGICGLDWVEELLARYPASRLVKVADLGYGRTNVYAATRARSPTATRTDTLTSCRLVSEYPNLAEAYAVSTRLRGFKVFPVWGAAEVYPPESADLIVLREASEAGLAARGLTLVAKLLDSSACLIANADAWERRDLSVVLACFKNGRPVDSQPPLETVVPSLKKELQWRPDTVWLALPDGHQKEPAVEYLERAGIRLEGYTLSSDERRPVGEWIDAKVIRPQDMPQQVANGNFDMAITGRDWLADHLARFPSSPVRQLLNLGFGKVRIVAAISQDLPVRSVADLRNIIAEGKLSPLRVCSEYVNIADKYLWENRLSPYRLIPTWGASEAFLPDDADLLIENTQTGKTLERQRLGIIDVLFESTACIIGSKDPPQSALKRERIDALLKIFRGGLEKPA